MGIICIIDLGFESFEENIDFREKKGIITGGEVLWELIVRFEGDFLKDFCNREGGRKEWMKWI